MLHAPGAGDVGTHLSAPSTGGNPVLLAVTDTQVQKLWAAVKNTDWTLQLRPVVKASDSPESVETKKTLTEDGLGQNQLRIARGG